MKSEAQAMVDLIQRRGIRDERVLKAMASVPRHEFVPPARRAIAYGDHALPIGNDQTISQPYMVALMTAALDVGPGDRVLEVGTGSGYQAAILAEMGVEVYSIERVGALHEVVTDRLEDLGYEITIRLGNGYYGWPEHAPYQGIIVTAAAPEVPTPLWEQLDEGGSLVIPLGPPYGYQTLWKIVKQEGEAQRHNLGGVAFVPFIVPEDS